ncbi:MULTISPECIES: hypothetical protein [Rhizobium/Agrobacterium group]|uniref:Uncharacterized protein n=1 Tax=Agrobacterium vitis TaxID=373 RepID=A0ABW9TG98_AGRVI|nr:MULTISPECIES: hypothetical protein [Rhizobium/Agrobacterium group]MUO42178.1 hypothetical protein [Agrobacterium vitis]
MTSSDLPDRLYLSGYVRLSNTGFALPAYQVKPGTNAWYAALPSVSGDHVSEITGFELLKEGKVEPFDTGILAGPGDAWRDIFLWAERAYAGRPAEIHAALEEFREDLLEVAPLSWLDLALPAEARDTDRIATVVQAFLEEKLGKDRGMAHYVSLVVRPGILIELRKAILLDPTSEGTLSLDGLSVKPHGRSSFEIAIASGLSRSFDPASAEDFRQAVETFAGRLGTTVDVKGLEAVLGARIAGPETMLAPPASRISSRLTRRDAPNVLIIAADPRAQAISRHLEPPPSIQFNSGTVWEGDYRVKRSRDLTSLSAPGDGVILIVDTVAAGNWPKSLSGFGVIIWLAGNEALSDDRVSRISELVRRREESLFLIAPAPPSDAPSIIMEQRSRLEQILGQASAVIDTTLARSPFWTGQTRRSIDRRMADMVATVGVLAASADDVREDMVKRGHSRQVHAVSLSIGERRSGYEMASELNATGLRGMQADRRMSSRYRFEIAEKGIGAVRNAIVDITPLVTDFERFGEATFLEIVGRRESWFDKSLITGVSDRLMESLDARALSVGLKDRDGTPLMVLTAEAPRLAAIREAHRSGLSIARYTDIGAIRSAAIDGKRLELPGEMRLGKLFRLPQNQGLVTRGLDTRDVVRVDERDWLDIRSSGTSGLDSQARLYRPNARSRDDGREIAIPVAAVWDGIRGRDPVALQLFERFPELRERAELGGKRPSDLVAAWTTPSRAAERWVIEDGRIPAEAGLLREGEVPAQRLFFIDGDEAVPCFVFSRLFAVWAKSLLPASTSWASRFQVSRTFDAFPFPLCFRIERPSEGQPQLRFSKGHRRLAELGHRLRYEFMDDGRRPATRGVEDERVGQQMELLEELDEILLGEMGMPLRASNLDILEALLERNRARL